jgi:NAD(P)-dependent dehydrogenase (short-subunit alcohol dehydrogenase family)
MTATFRLDGQVGLVTGAASGIGARVAVGLAEFGADVGCVDVSADRLAQTAEAIRALGRRALVLPADVTDATALEACVAAVEAELGPLRLAVNSAGIHSDAPAEDMERAMWQRLVDVNLTGVFQSCQAEGRAMLRNGGGSIVNVASISGTIANRGLHQIHYNATKAAIVQLTRSLALEWADRGIRVNALSPGYVRTGLSRNAHPTRTPAQYVDDVPLKRVAEPAEMVGPVVFLLSAAGSYCTATELIADGGAIAW